MPKMGVSQILPMVLLLGLNQYDLEKLGYTTHVEITYVVVQLACLSVLALLYTKIQSLQEGGVPIQIPEQKQFGTVVKPATEQTAKEYQHANWKEQANKLFMGALILGGIYYKWRYLTPLVMQAVMTPAQLMESELFAIHVRGKKDVKMPFPTPNPFGMPSMTPPEPEPAPVPRPELPAATKKNEGKKRK